MEQQAVEIVKKLFSGSHFAHERITPGCSGSVIIRVMGNGQDVVVRFWNMQWKDYFAQDLACHRVASEAGYGPKLFFADAEKGITVMQYVKPLSLSSKKQQLQALAALLSQIHKGPQVPCGIDRKAYLDTLVEESKNNHYGVDVEALRVIKNEVLDCTQKVASSVACHRDLHPGNLLYSSKGYFAIDYTWGAMDDPFADLANVAIFHCSTPQEEQFLLQSYFGREPSREDSARLALMKLPAKMFYGLEFLWLAGPEQLNHLSTPACYQNFGLHGKACEKTDFLAYSLTLLNEIRAYANSDEYRLALSILH